MSEPKFEGKTLGIPERSTKKMVGYSLSVIVSGLLYSMFNQIQFFAVSLLLIPQATIAMIFLIYSIVDGANDPLFGYLADRSKKFTSKYGKRFPWIIIGTFVSPVFLILCFIPINTEAVILSAVILTFFMCIYESLRTVSEINISALFPDMFRSDQQRRKVTSIGIIIGIINSLLGVILIPLLISALGGTTKISAYIGTVIIIVVIVCLIAIPFSLGIREPDDMKKLRTRLDVEAKSTSPIKEVLVRIFKDKNWMAFTLTYFFYTIAGYCVLTGINFYVIHGLGLDISATIIPQLGALLMAFVAIPLFSMITKKFGAKMGYLMSLIFYSIFFILFFVFVNDIIGFTILLLLVGVATGGHNYMYAIISSEAIDNAVVQSGKREEATYNGILRIFSGFCYFFQALIFTIVGTITGYNASLGANQTELAKLGLKMQMSLIPLFMIVISMIILIIFYTITKNDAEENKVKLLEMGL